MDVRRGDMASANLDPEADPVPARQPCQPITAG